MTALSSDRVINGSFGKVYLQDGRWLANIQRVEARIAIERREIRPPGTRETGYKAMNTTGEGTLSGFKVNSFWVREIGRYQREPRSKHPRYTLRYVLDDPDAFGQEEIELKYVKFWEAPLGYTANEILEESVPFTFQNHNLLQCSDGTLDEYADGGDDHCG
jgi:hypothetical protein